MANLCQFITNDLTVKNNRGLKNRGQFAVEMEIERTQMSRVLPLEEYDEGTHFKVTIEPILPEDFKPNANG